MGTTSALRQAMSTSHASLTSVSRTAPVAQAKRRLMGTASSMALPLNDQPDIDIQIFDIFDAPSRLGESSKLLARAAGVRTVANHPARTMATSAVDRPSSTCYIKPLPSPILYDGPARPKHLAHGSHRARRAHSHAISGSLSQNDDSPFTLPSPIVFDGPSRLRPYGRDTSSEQLVSCTIFGIHITS